MGAAFDLQHANLIAYLTDDALRLPPPRIDATLLDRFFLALANPAPWEHGGAIVSRNPGWADELRHTATEGQRRIVDRRQELFLEAAEVAILLQPLRRYFTGYQLYSLVIPGKHTAEIEPLFHQIAQTRGSLALMPRGSNSPEEVIDPFPAIRALAEMPFRAPGVVFWTPSGAACAMSAARGSEILEELRPFIQDGEGNSASSRPARQIDAILARQREHLSNRYKKILHLSDLHFGGGEARRRNGYLRSQLDPLLPEVDRVVVTGDLFDSPDRNYRQQFMDFRHDVERNCKAELILVPGNHDLRRMGIFGENYRYIADCWTPIVIDERLRTIFFCFNSSEYGRMARGRISDQQLLDRASSYQGLVRRKPDVTNYMKIALVHHHPFPFINEPAPTAAYERLVASMFGRRDALVEFTNAEQFLTWCDERGISLILHGHKHVPRQKVTASGSLVVGCGSSTGHGGGPMCYDMITLDPSTSEWSASFYFDRGDGAGFALQAVTVEVPAA